MQVAAALLSWLQGRTRKLLQLAAGAPAVGREGRPPQLACCAPATQHGSLCQLLLLLLHSHKHVVCAPSSSEAESAGSAGSRPVGIRQLRHICVPVARTATVLTRSLASSAGLQTRSPEALISGQNTRLSEPHLHRRELGHGCAVQGPLRCLLQTSLCTSRADAWLSTACQLRPQMVVLPYSLLLACVVSPGLVVCSLHLHTTCLSIAV